MEIKDREFILANIHNFETIEHGYVRNLGGAMHDYERIYKTYLDPGFVLQAWCSDCVFNMIKRLKHWWYSQNTAVIEVDNVEKVLQDNNIPLHPKKANRKRK